MAGLGKQRAALTRMDVIVGVVVTALLLAMLSCFFPTVRETGPGSRRTECRNNLTQLARATLSFKSLNEGYPSGGWGYNWTGDPAPERGNGVKQPGDWLFVLLPHLQMLDMYEASRDLDDTARKKQAAVRVSRSLEFLHCPTRRPADVYPIVNTPINSDKISKSARTDYAMCAGSNLVCVSGPGPATVAEGDSKEFWKSNKQTYNSDAWDGVSYIRSQVRKVEDGDTYTYLLGEKFMDPTKYTAGTDPGDDRALFTGFGPSSYRVALIDPQTYAVVPPQRDAENVPNGHFMFGSTHKTGFHMAFCDGRVRMIKYDIDPQVHGRLASRFDSTNHKNKYFPQYDSSGDGGKAPSTWPTSKPTEEEIQGRPNGK